MEPTATALWEAIGNGHQPSSDESITIEQSLIGTALEGVAPAFRAFGDAESALGEQWTSYWAGFEQPHQAHSNEALVELATEWVDTVGRSAAGLRNAPLADVCAAGCTLAQSADRPPRPTLYRDWTSHINDVIFADPERRHGAIELSEAFWGATHSHETVWFLLDPIIKSPVDADPYVRLIQAGGNIVFTDDNIVVFRR